ncbi:TrkA family potassium uptake protein [bacterium]|nr:TrkA family potassium uptake protein [bacterium]
MYIIIGGGGKVGEVLARQLLGDGHEIVIIERRDERADELARDLRGRYMVVRGDCCDSRTMDEAGMRDADIFIVVTGHDDVNLVACEVAETLYHPSRIVARVNNPKNERIFQKLGINAISSTVVIARMIEEEALSTQMRTVMTLRNGDLAMLEVEIPHSSTLKADGGIRVSELELPPPTVLVAVSHEDEFFIVNGGTILQPGDTVLVCTTTVNEQEVRRALLDL